MHLRHRHRHAAGNAGDEQQHLQRRRRERQFGLPARRRSQAPSVWCASIRVPHEIGRAAAWSTMRKGRCRYASRASRRRRDEMLHHRRPDRAGEIVAGGRDGDGDAAPAHEPVRHLGHQRPEGGRAAEADQQAVGERHLPKRAACPHRRHSRASSANAPSASGTVMPKRSASLPMTTPPAAKPSMVSV